MDVDRNGLEVLERDECLRLLGGAHLGRVGVSIDALPTVLPVNFKLIDDEIVIRTGAGTKLDAATCNSVVAFEVDDMDGLEHTGWSVVVTGVAREVTDESERSRLAQHHLSRWAPYGDGRIIAISTDVVSGRRIR